MKKIMPWLGLMTLVAGAALSQEQGDREAIEKQLADPDVAVRLKAALGQAKANNAAAVPVLIDLVAVLPPDKRAQVEEVLRELAGEWAPTAGPAGEDEIARKIRRDAWAAWWANANGPALTALLAKHTLTPAELERVQDGIRRLGDKSYAVREKAVAELIGRGRRILPMLRDAMKEGKDLEVVRRAQRCIERIEQEPANRLPSAALRLLALRKPAGAAEALLAYVPFAEEDHVEDVKAALAVVALRDGKPDPALIRALGATNPALRSGAAEALAQAGGADVRPAIRKLLADADLSVRLRAAAALVSAEDKEAVPTLIALLEEKGPQAASAEEMLFQLAGDRKPPTPPAERTAESLKKYREAWAMWWKDNETKIELTKVAVAERTMGFTAVATMDQNRVGEIDKTGKYRWTLAGVQTPSDVQWLPGNKILVAEHGGNRVTERDAQGKVLWEHRLPNSPVSARRLPNGNTLMATYSEVREVDRAGKVLYTFQSQAGQIFNASKTSKGTTLYVTSSGRIGELDRTGKEIRVITQNLQGTGYWSSVEALPNGRFLVALGAAHKAVEIDASGKVFFECPVQSPGHASRLPNGHTLVASIDQAYVAEFDRAGKEVWRQNTGGRTFRAWRR